MIKKILKTTGPYTTTLKNRMQKTLDKIIGEHQSVAIEKNRTTLYTLAILLTILFSTICDWCAK